MASDNDPTKSKPSNYLKYGSLTMQLFCSIGLAGWAGYKLDQHLENKFPAFLLSFVIIVLIGMMYRVYKSINQE